jgi:Sel1 repeat
MTQNPTQANIPRIVPGDRAALPAWRRILLLSCTLLPLAVAAASAQSSKASWYGKAAAQGVTVEPTPSKEGPSNRSSTKVSIFIGPQIRDGFVDVDSGVIDSIRDIQNELKRSAQFVVVDEAQKATIVLVVVGRRLSGNGGAVGITTPGTTLGGGTIAGVQQPTFTTPGVTTMVPIDRHAIDTVLRVGTYERAITSEEPPYGSGWASVARVVVKDVTAWLEANRFAAQKPRADPSQPPAQAESPEVAKIRQAAEQGDPGAQFSLGSAYATGKEVPKDYAQAAMWLRKAAEQGNAGGQVMLGALYGNGQGVPQDYSQSLSWFRKGAEQGNDIALVSLGTVYSLGRGVPQDFVEAHKWYNLGAARASTADVQKMAAEARDKLAKSMTPQQIAEAQKGAGEWVITFERRSR